MPCYNGHDVRLSRHSKSLQEIFDSVVVAAKNQKGRITPVALAPHIWTLCFTHPYFLRHVLEVCWWHGAYPRFLGGELPPSLSPKILPVLSFVVPDKSRDGLMVYAQNEYFLRFRRWMTIASFVGRRMADVGDAPCYFRFWHAGIWMPWPISKAPTWYFDVASELTRRRLLEREGSFIEIAWNTHKYRDICVLPEAYIWRQALDAVEKVVEHLPDRVRVRGRPYHSGTSVGGASPVVSGEKVSKEEALEIPRGVRKTTQLGSLGVEITYGFSHLRELVHDHIELLKLRHLGRIGQMIVHEFNNPISGIYTLSQLMQEEPQLNEPEVQGMLKQIETQCVRVRQILHHLSAYFQWDGNTDDIPIASISVDTLFSEVAMLVKPAISRCVLNREIHPPDMVISSDRLKLLHVLVNLVLNAAEALSSLSGEGIIFLRAYRNEKGTWLEVEDNGPGIPSHLEGRVFEPFFSTKKKHASLQRGLGLTLVKFFLDELSYSLTVQSEPHERTIFRIGVGRNEP